MNSERIFDRRWVRITYALLITGVSLLMANPYEYGVHDHWYMLPWIKNMLDPELFAIDPVIAQRQFHYSVLYNIIAASPLSTEWSFLVMYMLALFTFFYFSMAIHRLFSKGLVFITPLFLLVPWFTPGGTFTIASHLLMRTTGLPILFAVLYFWLCKRPWIAWPLLGVSFLFHPTTALYMAAFIGVHMLLDPERRSRPKDWLAILGFVVLSIPVFIEKFTALDTGFPGFWADQYWLETIRIRSAHHAFPDAWHPGHILSAGILVLGLVIAIVCYQKQNLTKFLKAMVIGAVIIYAAGLLFTYVWPSFLAIQVQPFRLSRLVMISGLLFIPIILVDKHSLKLNRSWLTVFLVLFLGAAYVQSGFHLFWYASLFGAILYFRMGWHSRFLPVLMVIPALILVANRPFKTVKIQARPALENEGLYNWVRSHSSQNSLWITPGDMMYFRNFTNRNVLVAWWDGTFGYFDYTYNREWRTRYEAVFGTLSLESREPQIKDVKTVRELTKPFPAEEVYVLKRKPMKSSAFKEIWAEGGFYIYSPTGL